MCYCNCAYERWDGSCSLPLHVSCRLDEDGDYIEEDDDRADEINDERRLCEE